MIQAQVLLHSFNQQTEDHIITWVLTYPHFIHPQFMTHRLFSRNAASSRALSVSRRIQAIQENPAIPVRFTKNGKGFNPQGDVPESDKAQALWLKARDLVIPVAQELNDIQVHKEVANRILEPWAHIKTLVTTTGTKNFYKLRIAEDVQSDMRVLAEEMRRSAEESEDRVQMLSCHEEDKAWHIPFLRPEEKNIPLLTRLKVSSARSARISYEYHEKETTVGEDIERSHGLYLSQHWSPFEHQARAISVRTRVGNFVGFVQLRKFIEENNEDLLPHETAFYKPGYFGV